MKVTTTTNAGDAALRYPEGSPMDYNWKVRCWRWIECALVCVR